MERLKGLVVVLLGAAPVWSADWLTDGGNTKRTAWQQDERTFSKATIDDTNCSNPKERLGNAYACKTPFFV